MSYNARIQDIAEVVMGQSPSGEDVNDTGDGLPLLNGPTEFTTRSPVPVQYTREGRKFAEPDDILFCVRGSTTGRMNYADQKYAIGRGIAAIRGKGGYPTPYVRAVIERNLDRLLSAATGSTFPNVGRDLLLNFEVETVSSDDAIQINDLIVSLEDKIELNRQINQTLEQIAQTIFKSWFVDFEPVKAKIEAKQNGQDPERAAMRAISGKTDEQLDALSEEQRQQLTTTAALFPDELEVSELGEIPKGWGVKTFGDVSQCFDSKRIPLSKKKREEKKPGNIPYYGATSIMDYVNEWIFDGIYLLLGEDGSVIKEDGSPFVQYIWGKTWVNNHAHVLQGKNGVSTEQLMLFIQKQNIAAYITGAVQLKLNQGNMNRIPFIDAGEELNDAFYSLIKPSYEKIRKTIEENQSLTELRDVLLPKLLAGEITLSNTQSTAAAVA